MNLPNQIETKRLILRSIKQDDFGIFSNIIKQDEVFNNLKFVVHLKPKENIPSYFRSIIDSYKSKHPIIALIIINKQQVKNIGFCGLIHFDNGINAEIFYTLFPNYRGYGYAIEAMKKLIEYAFKVLNLTKIITYTHPTNSKSWNVAERIGMKYMGHKKLNNDIMKAMFFSMEKAEFELQYNY